MKKNRLDRVLEDYMTAAELARAKGFTPAYVRQMIAAGKLRASKLNNTWYIHVDDAGSVKRLRAAGTKKNQGKEQ